MLDKNSPLPLYYQLAEDLRDKIRAGELKPGEQVPTERELSEMHTISRMTARQALQFLVREEVLVSRQGSGTYVAEPKLTYDPLQDGQLTRQDAIVPGSTYLGVAKGDHFAVALPFDKSSDATIKTGMDKTKYPRGALIESLLRFVTDDLAKKKR